MRSVSREDGLVVMEVLLLLLVLGMFARWAVPSAIRAYKYGAVRYEAEQLLGELRYAQMKARTTAQSLKDDGGTTVAGTRPRLMLTGTGYRVYQGRDEVKRHSCLYSVRLKLNDSLEGSDQTIDFYANGNVYPNATIKIFASGGEGIGCKLVIDAAGRFRLERIDAGG